MKNYISKHILLTISVISFILLLIPVTIFLYHFSGNNISHDLAVWGTFGDFIGGTINTILTLSSLVILGLLTHNIGKQSNEENKKTNLLLRKYDSYDLLSKYFTDIELLHISATLVLDRMKVSKDVKLKEFYKDKLEEEVSLYFELYALLVTFKSRFGHLYLYDFDSKNYEDLVADVANVKDLFMQIIKHTNDKIDSNKFVTAYEKSYNSFRTFLNTLAQELK